MIVCISDIHLGRGSRTHDREVEDELIACLEHLAPNVEELILLGDVFDYYIEYDYLIPKGFLRFQALLVKWADAGVPITYLVGNHDPWHQNYFTEELGIDLHHEPIIRRWRNQTVYLGHGDGSTPSKQLYQTLRPLLRHPLPVYLYRTLLPADTGIRLARWFSRKFAEDEPDPAVIDDLRRHARHTLRTTGVDLVILGHSHGPAIRQWPEGTYVNAGSWYFKRTLIFLDDEGVFLHRWNGKQTLLVEQSQTVEENPES